MKSVINRDGTLTVNQIAKMANISSENVLKILKGHLGVKKISARWFFPTFWMMSKSKNDFKFLKN